MDNNYIVLLNFNKNLFINIKSFFNSGKFLNTNTINPNDIITEEEIIEFKTKETISNDTNNKIYRIKEEGISKTVYTTYYDVYDYFVKNGSYPEHLQCCRCRTKIKELFVIPVDSMIVKNKEVFMGYAYFHSLQCAYDEYAQLYSKDVLFKNSEMLFNKLSFLSGIKIIKRNNKTPDLLDINGGPLRLDQFDDPNFKLKSSSFVFFPVKRYFYGN